MIVTGKEKAEILRRILDSLITNELHGSQAASGLHGHQRPLNMEDYSRI